MTENIDHYTFDFEKEVNDLKCLLGSKADNILFSLVDVSETGPDAPVNIDIQKEICDQRVRDRYLSIVQEHIKSRYTAEPNKSSFSTPYYDAGGLAFHLVSFRSDHTSYVQFGEENQSLRQLNTFYHEVGHVLIPGGPEVGQDHPFRESAADAYAALMLLQRFGREAVPVLLLRSWDRSYAALLGGTEHMTTPVLDKIIADSARRDFSNLTQDDMIKLAVDYSWKWTPTPDMLAAVRSLADEDDFFGAAETCLRAPDKFSFYIGAKFFQPFLATEGYMLNGQQQEITNPERQQFAKAIRDGASSLRLRDIFNDVAKPEKAGPALNTAIRTQLPAGQKLFTLKFS